MKAIANIASAINEVSARKISQDVLFCGACLLGAAWMLYCVIAG